MTLPSPLPIPHGRRDAALPDSSYTLAVVWCHCTIPDISLTALRSEQFRLRLDMRDPKKSGNEPVRGSAGKEIVVTHHEISIDDRDVVILCGGRDHLDEMSVRETGRVC